MILIGYWSISVTLIHFANCKLATVAYESAFHQINQYNEFDVEDFFNCYPMMQKAIVVSIIGHEILVLFKKSTEDKMPIVEFCSIKMGF